MSHAVAKRIDITCVWSSKSSAGKPNKIFNRHSPVALLASWHLGHVPGLSRDRLEVKWTVYAGWQNDVSLAPPHTWHHVYVWAKDPSKPMPGVFRLLQAPIMKNLGPGWYSLLAQSFLYGTGCAKHGCTGQVRQNRFYIRPL